MLAQETMNARLEELAIENMDNHDHEGWLGLTFGSTETFFPYREFDTETSYIYQQGYCAFLALAIHEATGLPLAVFTIPGSENEDWLGHVAIRTGENEYFDISGFSNFEEINERYGSEMEATIVATVSDVPQIFHADVRHDPWSFMGELEELVTRDYADQLIKRYLF